MASSEFGLKPRRSLADDASNVTFAATEPVAEARPGVEEIEPERNALHLKESQRGGGRAGRALSCAHGHRSREHGIDRKSVV